MSFPKLQQLDLKQKIIINSIMLVLIVGSIIAFSIWPNIQKIKWINIEIKAQKEELEMGLVKLSRSFASGELRAVSAKLTELDKLFIKKGHEIDFIAMLENIAKENNIKQKLNINNLEEINNCKGYKKAPLQIFTQGSFLDAMNYLAELERLDYYINIDKIDIAALDSANNENGKENVKITISANAYWGKDDSNKINKCE